MKQYIGTKTVHAEPMTEAEFRKEVGMAIITPEQVGREGYKIIYPDGYKSWSPKDVFEAAYDELLVGINGEIHNLVYPPVFPSEILSVAVYPDDEYGGAHKYQFQNSLGFSDGEAKYDHSFQKIQFVQKNADGTITPGLQSEQLIIAILDRTEKLNNKFPSEENVHMMDGLLIYLEACKKRIQDRIDRGVMGQLKK